MKEHVLLVGATSGIGRALCQILSSRGASITAVARDSSRLNALQEELSSVQVRTGDVTNEASVKSLFEGLDELTGIVNCAGSVLLKPLHLTTATEWEQTFAVNVRSCFLLLKYGLPKLASEGSSVVFFSTSAARSGLANHDGIASAKSAVEGLTRAAASTYAPRNVRINAIAPGLVKTPLTERIHGNATAAQASRSMHALGRLGTPEEVASLAAWLLSSEASWMTGQCLTLDGGLSLRPR